MPYCAPCCDFIHTKGARARHTIVPYGGEGDGSESDDAEDPRLLFLRDLAAELRTGVNVQDRGGEGGIAVLNSFVAKEAIDWLEKTPGIASREEAVAVGQELLDAEYFVAVDGDTSRKFVDNDGLYAFYAVEAEDWLAEGTDDDDGDDDDGEGEDAAAQLARNYAKLQQIHACVSGLPKDFLPERIAESNRRFLHAGSLDKYASGQKRQERYFFLFSDLLIWTEKKGDFKFRLCKTAMLRDMTVKDVADSLEYANAFVVTHHPKKEYTLIADTPQSKAVWLKKLGHAVERVTGMSAVALAPPPVNDGPGSDVGDDDESEKERWRENYAKLQQISVAVSGLAKDFLPKSLGPSNRQFLHSGVLHKHVKGQKKVERYFFLFSDMLLWTEQKGKKKYKMRKAVPLHELTVRDIADSTSFTNAFAVTHHPKKEYVLSAPTAQSKKDWVKKLSTCVANLTGMALVESETV